MSNHVKTIMISLLNWQNKITTSADILSKEFGTRQGPKKCSQSLSVCGHERYFSLKLILKEKNQLRTNYPACKELSTLNSGQTVSNFNP